MYLPKTLILPKLDEYCKIETRQQQIKKRGYT